MWHHTAIDVSRTPPVTPGYQTVVRCPDSDDGCHIIAPVPHSSPCRHLRLNPVVRRLEERRMDADEHRDRDVLRPSPQGYHQKSETVGDRQLDRICREGPGLFLRPHPLLHDDTGMTIGCFACMIGHFCFSPALVKKMRLATKILYHFSQHSLTANTSGSVKKRARITRFCQIP